MTQYPHPNYSLQMICVQHCSSFLSALIHLLSSRSSAVSRYMVPDPMNQCSGRCRLAVMGSWWYQIESTLSANFRYFRARRSRTNRTGGIAISLLQAILSRGGPSNLLGILKVFIIDIPIHGGFHGAEYTTTFVFISSLTQYYWGVFQSQSLLLRVLVILLISLFL